MINPKDVVTDAMEGNVECAQYINTKDIENPDLDARLAQSKKQALECVEMQVAAQIKADPQAPQNEQELTLANNTPEIPSGP